MEKTDRKELHALKEGHSARRLKRKLEREKRRQEEQRRRGKLKAEQAEAERLKARQARKLDADRVETRRLEDEQSKDWRLRRLRGRGQLPRELTGQRRDKREAAIAATAVGRLADREGEEFAGEAANN
jgi:hypothetical protein